VPGLAQHAEGGNAGSEATRGGGGEKLNLALTQGIAACSSPVNTHNSIQATWRMHQQADA
jgi:hypothetical protein